MKAKHLIEFLETVDPEKEVVLHFFGGESVESVSSIQNKDECCLETESDVNMREQLKTRFEEINKNLIEYKKEMYATMLQQGLTVKTVERYMGREYSDEMKKYL